MRHRVKSLLTALLMLALLLSMTLPALADGTITVTTVSGQKGEQVAVELSASPATLDIGGRNVRTYLNLGMSGVIEEIPLWELPGTLTGTLSGSARLTQTALAPGDQVVLLPDGDGQTYFVLCKAVRP